jgi:biotin transport system substrate-specific component
MNPGEVGSAARTGVATTATRLAPRILGVVLGAAAVALAAQVAIPLSITRVPLTLQPLAVLVVGGLLGAAGGASALVLYLAAGASGLPVFAGGSAGALHLLGPTGGYLLAFPVAAAVTGWLCGRAGGQAGRRAGGQAGGRAVLLTLMACVLGMLVIHVGGVSQLAILTGDPAAAFRLGFLPFFTNDLVKVGLAALVILALRPRLRAIR